MEFYNVFTQDKKLNFFFKVAFKHKHEKSFRVALIISPLDTIQHCLLIYMFILLAS